MNYVAKDVLMYSIVEEGIKTLPLGSEINQAKALELFQSQGVIDGLVAEGRLEVVGGMSATKKVKEGLAEIAESIVETVKDFGKK